MGGNAFLIWGMLAEHQLQPAPIQRTFMDRIMGRQRFQKPSVMDLGGGRKMIDFPADKYRILASDFRAFLRERMPDPWLETQAFFDYLTDDAISIYVRGEQSPERTAPEYYIQVTFSGCAGLAETSAELGSHWAHIYYRESHERLKSEYLNHWGFVPDDARIDSQPQAAFLPVGRLGYAVYVGKDPMNADPEWEGSQLFELNSSIVDAFFEQGKLSKLRQLDDLFGEMMSDGKCRCQLCMPGLDRSLLGEWAGAGL